MIGLCALYVVIGCSAGSSGAAVVPEQIKVSADRRSVDVQTAYPLAVGCAKSSGGLSIDVVDDVATVEAIVENGTGSMTCTLECGHVVQSITLDEPLPEPVQFAFPGDADPGCGGRVPEVVFD